MRSAKNFSLKANLILGLICWFNILPLFSQRSQDWMSGNDRGNRYEGTYTAKVNNPSINLISLTGYFEPYEFGKKQNLTVRFYSPNEKTIQLKAEELLVSRYYWMEGKNTRSKMGWNQLDSWPVDFLLKGHGINYRNLAILVQYTGEETRRFLPALVYHSQISPVISRYLLQFRLGRPVASGSYKIYKGETRAKTNLVLEGNISSKSGGMSFPVAVPITALSGYEGWVLVEINLLERGTLDPFSYTLYFFHSSSS